MCLDLFIYSFINQPTKFIRRGILTPSSGLIQHSAMTQDTQLWPLVSVTTFNRHIYSRPKAWTEADWLDVISVWLYCEGNNHGTKETTQNSSTTFCINVTLKRKIPAGNHAHERRRKFQKYYSFIMKLHFNMPEQRNI